MQTTFKLAKQTAALLDADSRAAGRKLDKFPRLPNGLTPDAVKSDPEYQMLKSQAQAAFKALQAFNRRFVHEFAKELRAERRSKN